MSAGYEVMSFANAAEAIEGLRHKRTGEILPSKTVARNTKLVYLDDDCVALKFHNTFIAYYERDHVRLDTRDQFNSKGWFTVTTWDRIDAFTPARTCQQEGLRYIALDPSAGRAGTLSLYAHGTRVFPNGSCEVPLEPEQSAAIADAKRNIPQRAARYAEKVVKAWREWREYDECCLHAQQEGGGLVTIHAWEHFEEGAVKPMPLIDHLANDLRDCQLPPDVLSERVSGKLAKEFRDQFVPLAIARIAPEFPYPQIAPRRR